MELMLIPIIGICLFLIITRIASFIKKEKILYKALKSPNIMVHLLYDNFYKKHPKIAEYESDLNKHALIVFDFADRLAKIMELGPDGIYVVVKYDGLMAYAKSDNKTKNDMNQVLREAATIVEKDEEGHCDCSSN